MIGKLLLTILLLFATCIGKQAANKLFTVPQFKRALASFQPDKPQKVKLFFVEGYYTAERHPILITDLSLLRRNSLIPDSAYITLYGKGIDSIKESRQKYEGAPVRVIITVSATRVEVLQLPTIKK